MKTSKCKMMKPYYCTQTNTVFLFYSKAIDTVRKQVNMASHSKTSGSKFRNKLASIKKARNWTEQEQELFCQILADPEHCFAVTLETKALKRTSNKEVLLGP